MGIKSGNQEGVTRERKGNAKAKAKGQNKRSTKYYTEN